MSSLSVYISFVKVNIFLVYSPWLICLTTCKRGFIMFKLQSIHATIPVVNIVVLLYPEIVGDMP